MNKRVLMVATVPSMIGQFNMNNIRILLELGYSVDVASDFTDVSVWPSERVQKFKEQLKDMNVEAIQLDFSRKPLKIGRHMESYRETVKLLKDRKYAFIHTHTPIASAIVRQAAHKTGTKVIYTAHGFHFYEGAPLKNWLIFYPIEKHYSRYTDVLITINKEDYGRAKKHFKAKKVVCIPGVGVDTEKFEPQADTNDKRAEIGGTSECKLIISVGELSARKNHKIIVEALQELPDDYWYVIVGKGELKDELMSFDHTGRLKLLGFRTDIVELLHAADLFVFPSLQEGLPVALMEAMAAGLPCIVSKIRGNVDLIDSDDYYLPANPSDIARKIGDDRFWNNANIGEKNRSIIKRECSIEHIEKLMRSLYSGW